VRRVRADEGGTRKQQRQDGGRHHPAAMPWRVRRPAGGLVRGRSPAEAHRAADDAQQHADEEAAEVRGDERQHREQHAGYRVERAVHRVEPEQQSAGDQQQAEQYAEYAADADVDD
jgi:hypothetical protein